MEIGLLGTLDQQGDCIILQINCNLNYHYLTRVVGKEALIQMQLISHQRLLKRQVVLGMKSKMQI